MLLSLSDAVIVRILRSPYPVAHRLADYARNGPPLPEELQRYADGVINEAFSRRGDLSTLHAAHTELSNECLDLLKSYYSFCYR